MAAPVEQPQIVHVIPGRVRIHIPGWSGQGQRTVENALRQIPGVRSVESNPITGNVVIRFDPRAVDSATLIHELRHQTQNLPEASGPEVVSRLNRVNRPPPALVEKRPGGKRRARISVNGMDRDPDLVRRVVEHFRNKPGVIDVSASVLTGRVLIEFSEHRVELEDLISDVVGMELPPLPGDDRPAHPLDPAPLVQSALRTVGATLGLGLLAVRRLLGATEMLPGAQFAAQATAVLGILQGFPLTRYGLRWLLGQPVADLLLSGTSIITLALSRDVLGLTLNEAEAVRLLTEVEARRSAWRRYEERKSTAPSAEPGATIRLEAGERTPRRATVREGSGSAIGPDGLPRPATPGATVPAGARLYGGPFVLELHSHEPFVVEPRPVRVPEPYIYDRYLQAIGPISLAYAGLTGLLSLSPARALRGLLLVNPRPALTAREMADLGASARVIRAGVTVVGTRPHHVVRRVEILLLDGPRVLTDGLELAGVLPLVEGYEPADLLARAGAIAAAAGAPWGGAVRSASSLEATEASFDGRVARGTVGGMRYSLGPLDDGDAPPEVARLRERGDYPLALRSEDEGRVLAILALRPRLAPGVIELVETCRRHGVRLSVLPRGDRHVAQGVARRAKVSLLERGGAIRAIWDGQKKGKIVAFVSDSAEAAAAFASCDLGIGLSSGRSRFPARADLLAPDLEAVAAIVETGARRDQAVMDGAALSIISNGFGAGWGLDSTVGPEVAIRVMYVAALAAVADGWLRLLGGERPFSSIRALADPHPERWGQRSPASVLRVLGSSEAGLSTIQAAERHLAQPVHASQSGLLLALLDQLRSPLTLLLAAGAGISLLLGSVADMAVIGATIVANAAIGAWQEHRANRASEALQRMGAAKARVLRDGQPQQVPASQVVPGDILLLAPGDRVVGDARLLSARGLEVDEAALTGESLPVVKEPNGSAPVSRVVLEGSDVTSGTGRAVVVAVGPKTRLGATSTALALEDTEKSPLGARLSRMLLQAIPVAVAGGALIVAAGVLRGWSLAAYLPVGVSVALMAVPEGLPMLAKMGETAVAGRLVHRQALVRHLSAVEALGRVDVACADKTGTLTQGRLALILVADLERDAAPSPDLPAYLRRVLLVGALASPQPDTPGASAHPTDAAVIGGARDAGLAEDIRAERRAESPFDPVQSFYASLVGDRLCIKGAPEALTPRCTRLRRNGEDHPLDDAGRRDILDRANQLAGRGLRVLMVAEGPPDTSVDKPRDLAALGFLGISDPLRPGVPTAVQRCREAGVRVIMLTGDHPTTARAIAREAGLLVEDGELLRGEELAQLENGELDRRLARASVIARVTPMDKLRIVESLRRQGHTVAMTGDGVNDAPSLRLADAGVAMGRGGTEVARQAADVVLVDDNFATLVETFVEGRGFWRNIRRALGLLLGGNLGELGLLVGASLVGGGPPLVPVQILAVNLITDLIPAVAVALQQPPHRNLAGLSQEGTAALDARLRNDILRRGVATALPSLAVYLMVLGAGDPAQAQSVAFASIVGTQLAQTLDVGRVETGISPSVLGAVAGSAGLLLAAFSISPVRAFLQLASLTPFNWALVGVGAPAAIVLSRILAASLFPAPAQPGRQRGGGRLQPVPLLPPPSRPGLKLLPAPQ